MTKSIRIILIVCIVAITTVFAATAKSLIDSQHQSTLEILHFPVGVSPQFSPEELARLVPDGLRWTLIDQAGNLFEWEEFCKAHENCYQVYILKDIPMVPMLDCIPSGEEYYDKYPEYLRAQKQGSDHFDDEVQTFADKFVGPLVPCTTDTDCQNKHSWDMDGNPHFQ